MWRLLHAVKLANLVEGVDAGRETTVKAEDRVLNDSSQRKEVKKLGELLPDIGVAVLSQALIIEAIPKTKIRISTEK